MATVFLQRKELSHSIAKCSNHVQTSVSSEGNVASFIVRRTFDFIEFWINVTFLF